jgi:hypothetical protein
LHPEEKMVRSVAFAVVLSVACASSPSRPTNVAPLLLGSELAVLATPPAPGSDAIVARYEAAIKRCTSVNDLYTLDLARAADDDARVKKMSGGLTGLLSVLGGGVAAATADNSPSTSKRVSIATAVIGFAGMAVSTLVSPGENVRSLVDKKLQQIANEESTLKTFIGAHGTDPSSWTAADQASWSTLVSSLEGECVYAKPRRDHEGGI